MNHCMRLSKNGKSEIVSVDFEEELFGQQYFYTKKEFIHGKHEEYLVLCGDANKAYGKSKAYIEKSAKDYGENSGEMWKGPGIYDTECEYRGKSWRKAIHDSAEIYLKIVEGMREDEPFPSDFKSGIKSILSIDHVSCEGTSKAVKSNKRNPLMIVKK